MTSLSPNSVLKASTEQIQLNLEGEKASEPELKKDYRYMTLEEQDAWLEVLLSGRIDSNLLLGMKFCASQWFAKRCPGCQKGKVSYKGCKIRRFCPRCASSYARGRGTLQYEYLRQIAKAMPFDLKMNQLVLTLPQSMESMNQEPFVVMVKEFLQAVGIEQFAYEIQFTRSRDPLGSRRIHAHVLSFNFRYDGSKFVETDYYFDLDKLRDKWKTSIQDNTGEKIEGEVDLHNEYASVLYKKASVVHVLAYLYRYPVTDLFNAWRKDRSYVHTRQINGADYFKSKNRLIWCGLFAPTARRKLEKLLGVSLLTLPQLRVELKRHEEKCPDCNIRYVVVDRGKYQGDNEPLL